MTTPEDRAAISRANGARSHGPVSEKGKRNSSRNSTRHGLLSRAILIDGESLERFMELMNSFTADFQPRDLTECHLIEKMAVSHWRLVRTWSLESAAIIHETRRQDEDSARENPPTRTMLAIRSMSENERHPDTLGRYARRYNHEYHAALADLHKYRDQKDRRDQKNAAAPPNPATPPKLPHEPAELSQNKRSAQTVEPSPDPVEPSQNAFEPVPEGLEPAA